MTRMTFKGRQRGAQNSKLMARVGKSTKMLLMVQGIEAAFGVVVNMLYHIHLYIATHHHNQHAKVIHE